MGCDSMSNMVSYDAMRMPVNDVYKSARYARRRKKYIYMEHLYKNAASRNHIEAAYELGKYYEKNGRYYEAKVFFFRAALLGHKESIDKWRYHTKQHINNVSL